MAAISFFKVVLSLVLSLEPRLRLPQKFVLKCKGSMPSIISVQARYGPAFQVEVTRSNGEIWLEKGLEQFLEYFPIKIGYFLVFKYVANDLFLYATIFDQSATEIDYPYGTVKEEPPEEDSKSIDVSNIPTRVIIPRKPKIEALEEGLVWKKTEQPAYKRARAFMSTRPTSICYMHHAYIVGALSINKCFAQKFMKVKSLCDVVLKGHGSRKTWKAKCRLESFSAKLRWKTFVEENGLCRGDACVLEIIDAIKPSLKVNIFRANEDEDVKDLVRRGKRHR